MKIEKIIGIVALTGIGLNNSKKQDNKVNIRKNKRQFDSLENLTIQELYTYLDKISNEILVLEKIIEEKENDIKELNDNLEELNENLEELKVVREDLNDEIENKEGEKNDLEEQIEEIEG